MPRRNESLEGERDKEFRLLDQMNRDEPYAAKLDTFRHEMAHYDYARQAGMKPWHLSLLAGYQQVKVGDTENFANAQLLCDRRAWQDLRKSAEGRMAYVRHLLAPVVVEELHGLSPKQVKHATLADNWDADHFLSLKKWKLSPKDAETIKNEVLEQLRAEITPGRMKQYSHAARQIIKGHYGQRWVSGFRLERYLDGENYDPLWPRR